ncbi:uncharacterized protein LOC111612824 [Centruroides sculpturatus]|uniref:uncharacterized protein LOC111612824 n=1 Tax=Centruroides sculpturatus TaxID=218467 RepID=UPI000C6ECCBD|nr:uncharacterized protein LOC111612824 [Centruroides sculpturatus]
MYNSLLDIVPNTTTGTWATQGYADDTLVMMSNKNSHKTFEPSLLSRRKKLGPQQQELNKYLSPGHRAGHPLWRALLGVAVDKVYVKRKLLKAQRVSLLKITKAYRTAPTSVLQVITGIPPIHLSVKANAASWYLTNLSLSDRTKTELISYLNIGILPSLDMQQTLMLNHKNTQVTLHRHCRHPALSPTVNLLTDASVSNINNANTIFTDWSKSFFGTGAAIVHRNSNCTHPVHKKGFKLADHCSIMQAEQYAIYKALVYINNSNQLHGKQVCICSDSQAALWSISKKTQCNYLHQLIIDELKKSKSNLVYFSWTRAHQGVIGNEEADVLAKETATSPVTPSFDDIPTVTVKNLIRETLIHMWQREWEEADTGKTTFKFLPNISNRLSLNHINGNHFTSQLLTGHGNFRQYLNRFHHSDTPFCQCDNGAIEDPLHFIFDCNLYDTQRDQLIHKALIEGFNWPCTPDLLINNSATYNGLIDFIRETGALNPNFTNRHQTRDSSHDS